MERCLKGVWVVEACRTLLIAIIMAVAIATRHVIDVARPLAVRFILHAVVGHDDGVCRGGGFDVPVVVEAVILKLGEI